MAAVVWLYRAMPWAFRIGLAVRDNPNSPRSQVVLPSLVTICKCRGFRGAQGAWGVPQACMRWCRNRAKMDKVYRAKVAQTAVATG